MNQKTVVLSIPALREQDLAHMPNLFSKFQQGSRARIQHSFPAVTWPSQTAVLTGERPDRHGIVSNGFFWREEQRVEMWTAWNEVIQAPQIWDVLKRDQPSMRTAAWFPMLSKGSHADNVCMPAPIHKPDGSEDLWCYTRPQEYYGELLERLGHFPLHHFWGPLANIRSSRWILESATLTMEEFSPDFWYIYLPHLDYAAQKTGPDSESAIQALSELDQAIGDFTAALPAEYESAAWLVISEYVITAVDQVSFPNRILRDAGLLTVQTTDGLEYLDLQNSAAWALVDHQYSHVYVKDRDTEIIDKVAALFERQDGFSRVLRGDGLAELQVNHERSGDVVLVSPANSWQAYYWWQDDDAAPDFARTVDIHRKPGYDPVELHVKMPEKEIPLNASLVQGSHGALVESAEQQGVVLCSESEYLATESIADVEIFEVMKRLACR